MSPLDTEARRLLREQATHAAGLIAARRGGIGSEWCAAYGQDVGRLLDALAAAEARVRECDALLRRWLNACDVNRSDASAYWCEVCDCFPEDHDADCPVVATRALLAQTEGSAPC